jgi:hypothetical protein
MLASFGPKIKDSRAFTVRRGCWQCTDKQRQILVRNIMNLVNDIEDRVTCDGEAVVACSHGSNRSFFMVNLYFQKRFDLSYEEVRQLMTAHRGLKDGPLHHSTSAAEPPEFLKRKFTHSTRPSVPLSKRYIHEARWNVPGLEYSDLLAYMRVEDGDTSTDSSEEEEGEEEEGGLEPATLTTPVSVICRAYAASRAFS